MKRLKFRKGVQPEIVQTAITGAIIETLTPEELRLAKKSDSFRQLVRDIGLKMLMRTSQSDDPWVLRVAAEVARTLLMDVQAEEQTKVEEQVAANQKLNYERELMIVTERVKAFLHRGERQDRPVAITQAEWLQKIEPTKGIDHGESTYEELPPLQTGTGTDAEEEGVLIDGTATPVTDDGGDFRDRD